MHEYDNHVEIVVREELDEEVEDPSVHVDQAVPNDNLQDASLVIRHKRRYRFKRRRLFEYLDEVETYEEEFKEVFRMSRVTFREVSMSSTISLSSRISFDALFLKKL